MLSKVALVVGVADYDGQPLANPVNDAKDVASALRMCDFCVIEALDVTLDGFYEQCGRFREHLGPGVLAVFYFAGHGLEIRGENFLFSIGFFKDLLMIEDFTFYLILVEGSFIHGDN